jgi:hypothetical protein
MSWEAKNLEVGAPDIWLRGLLCCSLPGEHRRDRLVDRAVVVRRFLPHGNKKSGRAAARCGDKPLHRTR